MSPVPHESPPPLLDDSPERVAAEPLPKTARMLDAVAMIAGLLAVTVAATGGFREWTPLGRLSMTSWLRPATIALAAALVRLYVWRRDPFPVRVARGVRVWWDLDETRAILPIYLSTRLGVLLVGFLAVVLIGYSASGIPWRVYPNEFLNLPARFDTGWYLGIASHGYQWNPNSPAGQQNIVFFPAYPMLIRYASLLVARQTIWTGVLISWVAFFAALVYVYRLGRAANVSREQSAAAITFLAAYPFAVFFSTAYSESVFMLAMAGACYHFQRDGLWQAGAWGLLAGLTRPNGCLLSVVLALMLLLRIRAEGWPGWRGVPWSRYADRLAVAALPGLGMIAYSTFIYFLTGDPLQWSKQQIGWGRSYRSIDTLVTDRIGYIGNFGFYDYASTQTVDMLYAAAVVFVLASVWPVFRRFGLPMAALVVLNVLPQLATGGLLSMGRMTAVLFPTFLWLGAVVRHDHRTPVAVAFAALQALCAAMFFTWRPIY